MSAIDLIRLLEIGILGWWTANLLGLRRRHPAHRSAIGATSPLALVLTLELAVRALAGR